MLHEGLTKFFYWLDGLELQPTQAIPDINTTLKSCIDDFILCAETSMGKRKELEAGLILVEDWRLVSFHLPLPSQVTIVPTDYGGFSFQDYENAIKSQFWALSANPEQTALHKTATPTAIPTTTSSLQAMNTLVAESANTCPVLIIGASRSFTPVLKRESRNRYSRCWDWYIV